MSPEVHSSNPVVMAVIDGSASRNARLAAARGVLPLPHPELLEILVTLAGSDDSELAENAKTTLSAQEDEVLVTTFRSEEIAPCVLDYFAGRDNVSFAVHEAILTNTKTQPATLVRFARETRNAQLLDILSLNQKLLIETPGILDAIIQNPFRSSEAGRRATETKHEFFEKERGLEQIANELRAQGKEAAAEFIEQGEFASEEDALFLAQHVEVPDSETDDTWLALEYIEELYEETAEQRQAIVDKIIGELKLEDSDLPSERISVINRIMKMGMKDRVRLAMKGDREARGVLIRDPNRIVAQAVINNPRITEQEMEKISTMRTIGEDVLRQIAISRQWSKSYSICHNLARNPRTPMALVLNILTRLQMRDIVALSKNKNVPDAVRRQAQRLTQIRAGKQG